jgi:hypothetical protein
MASGLARIEAAAGEGFPRAPRVGGVRCFGAAAVLKLQTLPVDAPPMAIRARIEAAAALAVALALTGCARTPAPAPDVEVYRRAEEGRSRWLEREVERLRADLRQAEDAMVAIESGQRGDQTRANAVSAIAEARIAVERAARQAPWRAEEVQEARRKLEEADRQLQAGHFGSAVFFASRASRIAAALGREGRLVAEAGNVRFVSAKTLNLRAEPSKEASVIARLSKGTPVFSERAEGEWTLVRTPQGQVGWVYAGLLSGG